MNDFKPILKDLWSNKPLLIAGVVFLAGLVFLAVRGRPASGSATTTTGTTSTVQPGGVTYISVTNPIHVEEPPQTTTTGTTTTTTTPGPVVTANPIVNPITTPTPTPPAQRTRTVTVTAWGTQYGSLFDIAKAFYGDGNQWPKIFGANKDKISDPNLIYPGQVLVVP